MFLGHEECIPAEVVPQVEDPIAATPDSDQVIAVASGSEQINQTTLAEETTDNIGPNNTQQESGVEEPALDPELLSALGEFTSDNPEYGDNIHTNLARLWHPLLKKGMQRDCKEKMDYLIPDNCRLLQAPKLNAEISAAIPDMVRNRDKVLAASQQQLGLAITAINRGMNLLLQSEEKIQAIKHLSNGCRLLCDSHYAATRNRIKLITPSIDKSFLHFINDSERDETLFGSALSEKIKAAKAIERQGLQIKNKPTRSQKHPPPQTSRPTNYQGNWSAPPRYPANRGGRGGFRKPSTSAPPAARRPYTAPQPRPAGPQDKSRAPAHQ